MSDDNKGFVLMAVLWVIMAIAAVAFTTAHSVRAERTASTTFMHIVQDNAATEAATQKAIYELFAKVHVTNNSIPDIQIWKADGTPRIEKAGDQTCQVIVTDESGKVDLNRTDTTILKQLFMNAGATDEQANIIVDSIQDWRDADSLIRLNGAEDDYYKSLAAPYLPKNADFESVDEILLVRGVTKELFFGSAEKKGVSKSLTVFNRDGKININTANRETLMAIPGATEEMVNEIIEARASDAVKGLQGLRGLPPTAGILGKYTIFTGTDIYTIEAAAIRNGMAVHGSRKTVAIDSLTSYRILASQSPIEATKYDPKTTAK